MSRGKSSKLIGMVKEGGLYITGFLFYYCYVKPLNNLQQIKEHWCFHYNGVDHILDVTNPLPRYQRK